MNSLGRPPGLGRTDLGAVAEVHHAVVVVEGVAVPVVGHVAAAAIPDVARGGAVAAPEIAGGDGAAVVTAADAVVAVAAAGVGGLLPRVAVAGSGALQHLAAVAAGSGALQHLDAVAEAAVLQGPAAGDSQILQRHLAAGPVHLT